MEKYTLILTVMPIIFVSLVIAISFILKRLTNLFVSRKIKAMTIFLLYMVYIYVTLAFSYNLVGFYSYTFILEIYFAYYFFPSAGHYLFLTTPLLVNSYYLLVGSYLGPEEWVLAIVGVSLFVLALFLKTFTKFNILVNIFLNFFFKFMLILFFSQNFSWSFDHPLDALLILIGSVVTTLLLWWLRDLRAREEEATQKAILQGQIDGLTGIYNFQKLGTDLQEFQKSQKPYVLAMIDLDYFKQLNDTFGHTIGNEVLIEFTSLLRTFLQQTIGEKRFSFYRFGGEEFCLLFFNHSKQETVQLLEAFQKIYPEQRQALKDQYTVTFSAGIEASAEHKYNGMATMGCADDALYTAKHAGRNRIHIYQPK